MGFASRDMELLRRVKVNARRNLFRSRTSSHHSCCSCRMEVEHDRKSGVRSAEVFDRRARQRDLGGPRPAAALHPFEGHGLGGLRPRRRARRRTASCRKDRWTIGGNCAIEIHAEVCDEGFNPELNSFTQCYGSKLLDASPLMLAPVGFLPPDDPRGVGTIEAIQKGLVTDGFVRRYQTETDEEVDGLKGTEGAFLMTSFWLADNLALLDATTKQTRCSSGSVLCNDVGLLSEEYDPKAHRLLGNFPQAFSHVALINTAANLSMGEHGPSVMRSRRSGPLPRRSAPAG